MKVWIVSFANYDAQQFEVKAAFKFFKDAVDFIVKELKEIGIELDLGDVRFLEDYDCFECETWSYFITEQDLL